VRAEGYASQVLMLALSANKAQAQKGKLGTLIA